MDFALVPFLSTMRGTPTAVQSLIVQPAEKTKAGFLARARALRDQAVKEGDQAYGRARWDHRRRGQELCGAA